MTSSAPDSAAAPGRRPVDAIATIDLTAEDRTWRVAEGAVGVFAVGADDGDGRRHPLLTAEPGDLLFPIRPADARGLRILATGLMPSAVEPFADDGSGALSAGMERWVESLSRVTADILPPEPARPSPLADAPGTVRLRSGDEVCGPNRGMVFLTGAAPVLLFGVADLPERVTLFPLTAATRLLVLADGEFAVDSEAPGPAGLREALECFHASLFDAFRTNRALALADTFNLARHRAAEDSRDFGASLREAAGVLTGRPHAVTGARDPVVACVAAATSYFGAPAEMGALPRGAEGLPPADRLALAVATAGLAMRPVRLTQGFWRARTQTTVVLPPGGAPVLLTPDGRTRMRALDPATGQWRTLDAAAAAALDGPAFALYPTLSGRENSGRALVGLALREARQDIAALLLFGLVAALLSLAPPLILGRIVNGAIPQHDVGAVVEFGLVLVAAGLGVAVFQFVKGIALVRAESLVETVAQPAVIDRLLKLPLGFFRTLSGGDIAQRALGVSSMRRLLAQGAVVTLLAMLFALVNIVAMLVLSPALTAVAFALVAGLVLLATAALAVGYRHETAAAALDGALTDTALQLVRSIDKIRVAGAETRAFSRWFRAYASRRRAIHRARGAEMVVGTLATTAPAAAGFVLFAFIALVPDTVGAAAFAGFSAAFATVLAALSAVTATIAPLIAAFVLARRMRPILGTAPDREQGSRVPNALAGRIEVRRVSVSYGRAEVLSDISLDVAPGGFTAIVGPSGSGKSTLLRVLLGLLPPTSGNVFYDGQDLAHVDKDAVRRQFGVVLQDGKLFPGSIADNIVASANVGHDEVWAALRLAGLEAEVRAMPMGVHTFVAEGATISGGQRQRLMLARALVRRPKILFLDEATSALDERTQAAIAADIDALNMSRIVIAHRLSTIRHADRIYVIDGGRIVESGTYDELMAAEGAFHALVSRQLE